MSEETTEKKKGLNIKVLLILLPLFIVQLVIVYVVTANILLDKLMKEKKAESVLNEEMKDPVLEEDSIEAEPEYGKFVYKMSDMVINPAGTNGQRYLLLELGFDVPSEEAVKALESKDVIVRDMINGYLSTKTLDEISDPKFKDLLKEGLITALKELVPDVKIQTIYFSKYIIN